MASAAATLAADSKELPALSLSVDRLPSSSPFPSPSSSFLPPPIPGAHEFALQPPKRPKKSSPLADTAPDPPSRTPTMLTPTRSLHAAPRLPTDPQGPHSAPSPAAHPRPASLASSRPAPPSPAASRRASTALSRASSTRSRPSSTQSPAPRRASALAVPDSPAPPDTPTPRRAGPVRIRDFAFPPHDDRHAGRGPDAPRPNKRLQRPLSAWSSASSSSAASDDPDDDDRHAPGWGGFKWGGLFGAHRADADVDADRGGPSQGDFERNFAETPEQERADPYAQWEESDEDEYDEEGGAGAGALLPGLYRAMFAFEPEGTAEMRLEEDQLVRVVGRGGGVGWAIVERAPEEAAVLGAHALVPEGYLEVVRLDEQ